LLLRDESMSALVLVVAAVTAVVWATWWPAGYHEVWSTTLRVDLGGRTLGMDLQSWVNSALMTVFFLVVGLEARREFDLGDLRDRRRVLAPLLVGVAGAAVPVGLFVAMTNGTGQGRAWGVAMSTDSALALGFLALLGSRVSDRVRAFVLTVSVVDDLLALAVIATVYSNRVSVPALLLAVLALVVFMLMRRSSRGSAVLLSLVGAVAWLATWRSGVDPVVVGLFIGLSSSAYPPARGSLERLTRQFLSFREQPTPGLARMTANGLRSTLSPNARASLVFRSPAFFVAVPLFALANAGLDLRAGSVREAVTARLTVAGVVAYVVGKPLGLLLATALGRLLSRGRVAAPLGWAALLGTGTVNASAFTVSLLVSDLVFTTPGQADELVQVKVAVLGASVAAACLTMLVFAGTSVLGARARARAVDGPAVPVVDLDVPVDPVHDHVRGPVDASVTLVEYGDFACGYCGLAEHVARAELAHDDDLRFVWRHLPLDDVHPTARLAAQASEAAAAQGQFWAMHDRLLNHQDRQGLEDLVEHARALDLDVERFVTDVEGGAHAARVDRDVQSADLSNVAGTPTFFVNGRRHHGAYDQASLRAAVTAARERAAMSGR
jgi:Na+/H+ antiporter NhaA